MKQAWLAGIAAMTMVIGAATLRSAPPAPTDRVQQVIERSKTTRKTYALYMWMRIEHPGMTPVDEWSAEFNAGALHRVETPRDRLIADCARMTGTHRFLPTGKTRSGSDIALTACGISTRAPFHETEWLGTVDTRFGKADRVRVTDAELVRTYDVSRDGVILRTVFEENSPTRTFVLLAEATAVLDKLPDAGMFDEQSLDKSFVPERFTRPPAAKDRQ
jgi:hypothetical protein